MTFSIEQAIFTQPPGGGPHECQLLGASPGISAGDVRELAAWGAGGDDLIAAASFNFHPLPSGAFCVSRTVRAAESDEQGQLPRIHTHCLVAAPDLLERFANHPLALYRAATAGPVPPVYDETSGPLQPLRFEGHAAAVDQILLARLAVNPGPRWMGALVAAVLDSACLAVANGPRPEELISGLLYCLPVNCRTEFSFATALRFSPRRPFRIVGSSSAEELGALAERYNLTVCDCSGPPLEPFAASQGWARLIERVLVTGQTPLLAAALSKQRFELSGANLPALALQVADEMERAILRRQGDGSEEESVGESCTARDGRQRAHAAHRLTVPVNVAAASAPARGVPPSETLNPDSPEILDSLERLDDSVFDAISGDGAAMETFRRLWPQLRGQLGDPLLQESREQYLRYALSIWEQCTAIDAVRNAERAIQVLEVLCLLFE